MLPYNWLVSQIMPINNIIVSFSQILKYLSMYYFWKQIQVLNEFQDPSFGYICYVTQIKVIIQVQTPLYYHITCFASPPRHFCCYERVWGQVPTTNN